MLVAWENGFYELIKTVGQMFVSVWLNTCVEVFDLWKYLCYDLTSYKIDQMYFLRNVDPEIPAITSDWVIQIQTRGEKAEYLAVASFHNKHSSCFLLHVIQRTI